MTKNYMPGVTSDEDRANFGRNFRAAREKLRRSQRDIYDITGVAQSHISEIESGSSNLAIDTMAKLSAAVDEPIWKLLKP